MVSKDTHFDAALVPSASERGGRLSKNDHLAEFLFSARFFNVTFCSTSVHFGLSSVQKPQNNYHRHGTVSWILAKAGSPDRFVASPLLLLYPTVRYPTVTIWAAWSYAGPSSPRPLKVAYHVADTSIEVGHRNEPEVRPAGGHPVVHETPVRPTPCSFLTEGPWQPFFRVPVASCCVH